MTKRHVSIPINEIKALGLYEVSEKQNEIIISHTEKNQVQDRFGHQTVENQARGQFLSHQILLLLRLLLSPMDRHEAPGWLDLRPVDASLFKENDDDDVHRTWILRTIHLQKGHWKDGVIVIWMEASLGYTI